MDCFFQKVKYNLSLSTKGEGTIVQELVSSGRTEYNSGSVVRLTAVPAVGYSFTGWTEDVTSTSNPIDVDINSAKTIKAVFDLLIVNLQIEVEGDMIVDAKFKTFGCGSAIASSSLATEWLKGKTLGEAGEISNVQIVEELTLPPVKIHCSVLAEDAIKSAIKDYISK